MITLNTCHYLIPPPDYFWCWERQDMALIWMDGSTMTFLREILPLVKVIAEEIGLPPLGSMLIVLTVAKQPDDWEQKWELLRDYAGTLDEHGRMPKTVGMLELQVRRKLSLIAKLPEDLRNTAGARLHLLRTLFSGTFNLLPTDRSCQIVDEMRVLRDEDLSGGHDLSGLTRLLRDLKALHHALEPWTAQTLEPALRTGLKDLSLEQTASEEELPLWPQETGDLWADLEMSQEDEFCAVATLARQFLAVMQLPRPLHHTDDQLVGGVSDLVNKGDPPQLLLSELAWDADVFAVRLAFKEALYLRRETPPASPLPLRYVLLDQGIFLWGRPRVYAMAAALALLKPRTPGEEVQLYGHVDDQFTPLILRRPEDLMRWWSRQSVAVDCQDALVTALGALMQAKPEAQPEIILITQEDVARELHQGLQRRSWPAGARFFLLTVNGEGYSVLRQYSNAGTREIRSVQLSPPKILEKAIA